MYNNAKEPSARTADPAKSRQRSWSHQPSDGKHHTSRKIEERDGDDTKKTRTSLASIFDRSKSEWPSTATRRLSGRCSTSAWVRAISQLQEKPFRSLASSVGAVGYLLVREHERNTRNHDIFDF